MRRGSYFCKVNILTVFITWYKVCDTVRVSHNDSAHCCQDVGTTRVN